MGLFDKIKQGLVKTKQLLNTDVRDLFKSQGRLVDEVFLEELRAVLIKDDMGVQAADAIVKVELKSLWAGSGDLIHFAQQGPTVVMVAGVNGAGKTTSIAKLTHLLQSQGKTVVLGAADTFRAAAVEQLTIWAQRLGV